MSKIREKESLECGRMHIWALKAQKLPGPQIARFAHTTLLHYIGNFQPQNLGSPLYQILDPHLQGIHWFEFPLNSKQNLADEWLRINRARPVFTKTAILDADSVPATSVGKPILSD